MLALNNSLAYIININLSYKFLKQKVKSEKRNEERWMDCSVTADIVPGIENMYGRLVQQTGRSLPLTELLD